MQALLTELKENVYIPFFDEPKKVNGGWYTNAKKLALKGDSYGKGIMCGVRDAASERKARCRKR